MEAKPRQIRQKILLASISCIVTLAIAELTLRALDYRYKPLQVVVDGVQTDWRFQHSFDSDRFIYDPDAIWRPREDSSVFNAQGFRGRGLREEKLADEYRIFALGDSNTLGWDNAAKDLGANWPEDLDAILNLPANQDANPARKEYSVINAGVWGYTSFQGMQRLKQILRFQPDMVLISFGSNDPLLVQVPDSQYVSTFVESLVGKSRIGQFALGSAARLSALFRSPRDEDLVRRVSVPEYKQNLTEIAQICKASNIQCVLLTRPFIGDCRDHPRPELWWKYVAPDYVAATVEVGRLTGTPVIDVNARFKNDLDLFVDESHFSEAGHQLAAEFIYEKILPLLPK